MYKLIAIIYLIINCHDSGLFIYLQSLLKLNQKVNMVEMKSLLQRELKLTFKVRIDDTLGFL